MRKGGGEEERSVRAECKRGGSIPQFTDEPEGKEDVRFHSECAKMLATPGIRDVLLLLLTLARAPILRNLSRESGEA